MSLTGSNKTYEDCLISHWQQFQCHLLTKPPTNQKVLLLVTIWIHVQKLYFKIFVNEGFITQTNIRKLKKTDSYILRKIYLYFLSTDGFDLVFSIYYSVKHLLLFSCPL